MTFPGGGGGGDGFEDVGVDVAVLESDVPVDVDDVTGRRPCGECINAKLA